MGDVVNLRRERKKRDRVQAQTKAQENRVLFGRTKAERQLTKAQREQEQRRLDGVKLEEDGRTPDCVPDDAPAKR
jgi:hypothetical protein